MKYNLISESLLGHSYVDSTDDGNEKDGATPQDRKWHFLKEAHLAKEGLQPIGEGIFLEGMRFRNRAEQTP